MCWLSLGKRTSSRRPREIILPASTSSHPDVRPIRAETRAKLVTAVAKGRRWLDELIAGTVTNVDQIAATQNCTVRQINMTISLAFLAPNLVQATVDGRLPRGVGVANLRLAGRMVPAIREARSRVSLVGIPAPGTEFFRPETKPKFRPVRLSETKYQKPYVEQGALTRPILAKSLRSEIRRTAWWRTQSWSNSSPTRIPC